MSQTVSECPQLAEEKGQVFSPTAVERRKSVKKEAMGSRSDFKKPGVTWRRLRRQGDDRSQCKGGVM